MAVKRIFFTSIILLLFFSVFGQDKPRGTFLKKIAKIGEPIQYSLSFRYPSSEEIIFPDSAYAFTPFEFVEKRYFKTKSDGTNSFDSVIYTLSSFELDSIQHLALPVFLIENEDTTKLFPIPDSVLITPSLTQIPDPPKVITNTNYTEVKKEFNFIYLLFGIALLVLISILFVLLFGKSIIRSIRIRKLRKQHYKFLTSFKEYISKINEENYERELQSAYSLWKHYLQQLTGKAFTSYSSKEITAIIQEENLKENLKKIDRAIYAHRFPEQPVVLLKNLTEYAQKFYERKISEIKYGSKK